MTHQASNFPRVAVLADDLTSAADGGSPFLRKELDVSVHRWRAKQADKPVAEVVSIDCGSRSMPADLAAETTRAAATAMRQAPLLFKTVDSTLRGHIRAELEAVYLACGRRRVVLAPAFPAAGRTTLNGVQYFGGIPVAESAYAQDPVHPVTTSRLSDLVPAAVPNLTILDAQSQDELNRKVAAIDRPEDVLWVGSPGLARSLAELLPGGPERQSMTAFAARTLIVVGSANPVSRTQVQRADAVPFATCVSAPEQRETDPRTVLTEIAEEACRHLADQAFGALLATGGDTMEAMLEQLNVGHFTLLGELEAGFPLGFAQLADGRNLFLGLKAGGFGGPDTLCQAAETLRRAAVNQGRT